MGKKFKILWNPHFFLFTRGMFFYTTISPIYLQKCLPVFMGEKESIVYGDKFKWRACILITDQRLLLVLLFT